MKERDIERERAKKREKEIDRERWADRYIGWSDPIAYGLLGSNLLLLQLSRVLYHSLHCPPLKLSAKQV